MGKGVMGRRTTVLGMSGEWRGAGRRLYLVRRVMSGGICPGPGGQAGSHTAQHSARHVWALRAGTSSGHWPGTAAGPARRAARVRVLCLRGCHASLGVPKTNAPSLAHGMGAIPKNKSAPPPCLIPCGAAARTGGDAARRSMGRAGVLARWHSCIRHKCCKRSPHQRRPPAPTMRGAHEHALPGTAWVQTDAQATLDWCSSCRLACGWTLA